MGSTLTWENGRQLKSFGSTTYKYDSNGFRTQKTVRGTTYNYTWADGKLTNQSWGSNNIHFYYDQNGTVVGFDYNGTKYTYVKNLQGDITAIVDSTGAVVANYSYDTIGALLSSSGTMANINPLRYRGYYYDSESELYYLQSRYYDCYTKRFINADAYCDTNTGVLGANMYAYCENNAVNSSDPTGEWDVNEHGQLCLDAKIKEGLRFIVWDRYADKRYKSCTEYSAPFHGREPSQAFNIIKELYNLSLLLKNKGKTQKTEFSYEKSGKGYTKLSDNLKFSVRTSDKGKTNYEKKAKKKSNDFIKDLNRLPTGDAQSRALMGLALHTVQDYFAHSVRINSYIYNNYKKYISCICDRMTKIDEFISNNFSKMKRCSLEDNKNVLSCRYRQAQNVYCTEIRRLSFKTEEKRHTIF